MTTGDYSHSEPLSGVSGEIPIGTERSATAIVNDLWRNTEKLLNEESALLRADVDRRTSQVRNDLLELSLAGAVSYAGALALVAAIVLGLSKRMEGWLAALLVGVVALATGFAMLKHSTHKLARRDLVPRTSIENAETTTHTIKEALR